jgi:hypothetical protein
MNHRNRVRTWLRFAAWAAALAATLLVASGAEFWHTDAPGSEATCLICHAAHMPALRAAPARTVVKLTALTWFVPLGVRFDHSAPSSVIPSPRAPPAA